MLRWLKTFIILYLTSALNVGFHEEPQCAAACPVDCCLPDPEHVENEEQLLAKKAKMHL